MLARVGSLLFNDNMDNSQGLKNPNFEGYNILKRSWQLFWDDKKNRFHNSNNSDGSYGHEGVYTVWPVAVMVQSIVDAARIYPDEVIPLMERALKSFDAYYSPQYHAYCASHNFNGNSDIYYDDNAQVASCFLTAYEVTQKREYLDKAVENVNFLMTGMRHGQFGGVRWHMEKQGSNACTTAEVGVAAMRLARFVTPNDAYVQAGKYCIDWVYETLQDPGDKLICDGMEPDGKGGMKQNKTKWTYNQGTTLTLSCMVYFATGDEKYKQKAEELAFAVTDHNTAIFDRDTPRMEARYYRDYTYFYHLLAEGLADFMLYFDGKSPQKVTDQVKGELFHHLEYMWKYIRDPEDGLYWQSLELFRINERTYEQFKELTGEGKKYEPRACEREHTKAPIEERKMVKSLISCGGAARIFFQSARVHPKVDL